MAYVDWRLKGPELATCNCAFGCPCQFNALPTHGTCRAAVAMRIDEGHFGDVRLDGLKWAALAAWPGPIHEGRGEIQPVVDARADERQRTAILTILSGGETEPGATFFSVFAAMTETVHEPLFRDIELEIDVAGGTGRFRVEGVVEAAAEPIRNPVTGKPHRARLTLPAGFEFLEAEFASGSARSEGAIRLANPPGSHAHLAFLHLGPHGVIA